MGKISEKEYKKLQARLKELEVKESERKRAEEELRKLKYELEVEVAERTKELEERIQKSDKSRKAMLYMVEDLNSTSKELKAAQERIIRSEKLATIGKLAGIMGHELRNPLVVIRNSIYFINMKLKDSMDKKIKKHLDILQTKIGDSDKIISDVLTFARIKVPALAEADINRVLKGTLSGAAIPETVKVQAEMGENLPKVSVDVAQMEQVFSNIISNAIQAMPDGGELKITTNQADRSVAVGFKDTGCGIPREDLDKVFEPLFSTKATGVGLGLTTCQSIIEGHRGKIEVESEVNKGTTFTIKLLLT